MTTKPDEYDAFYTPCGQLGSRTSVSFNGKWIGEYKSDDEALEAILVLGRKDNYFPDVWFIDDHGGHLLIEDFNWDN